MQGGKLYTVADGRLKLSGAEIGIRGVERTEVLTGMRPGERVVISPVADLRDGQRSAVYLAQQGRVVIDRERKRIDLELIDATEHRLDDEGNYTVNRFERGAFNVDPVATFSNATQEALANSFGITRQTELAGCNTVNPFGNVAPSNAARSYIKPGSSPGGSLAGPDAQLQQVTSYTTLSAGSFSMSGVLPWQLPAGEIGVAFGAALGASVFWATSSPYASRARLSSARLIVPEALYAWVSPVRSLRTTPRSPTWKAAVSSSTAGTPASNTGGDTKAGSLIDW